jgi:hypothetical protein
MRDSGRAIVWGKSRLSGFAAVPTNAEGFMYQIRLFVGAVMILGAFAGQAFAGSDDPWFFTADEIASAYRYQQQFGARLHNPLDPQACLQGKQDFSVNDQGHRFAAPCRFVKETIRQLRELLESGAAKYLFPLDVADADLALPAEVYASKYKNLPREEILPALLREPTLVAVYHTAVHLKPEAGARAVDDAPSKRRAVAGFFDGQSNQILPLGSDGRFDYDSQKLVRVGGLIIMAHFLGEITLVTKNSAVTFDLSFDSDRAAANSTDVVAVRWPAR